MQIKFCGYMLSSFTPKLRREFGNSIPYNHGIFSPSCFSFVTSLGLQGSRRSNGENVVNFKHIEVAMNNNLITVQIQIINYNNENQKLQI